MRVDASSGNLVGVGSAAVGVVVAFLMYLQLIPTSSAVVLLSTFSVICILAFYGAWLARHHPTPTTDGQPARTTQPNDDRKPHVRLEIRRDDHTPQHTYMIAMNDGDLAAINVSGECVLRSRDGDYTVKFGPANVGVTPEPTLIPMTLFFSDGRQLQSVALDRPPECEWKTSDMQAFLGAAQGEFTGGEGIPFVRPRRPEPLACKFNVAYTDPDKRERYNRTHILRYSGGTIRIDLDEAPDPAALTPA